MENNLKPEISRATYQVLQRKQMFAGTGLILAARIDPKPVYCMSFSISGTFTDGDDHLCISML